MQEGGQFLSMVTVREGGWITLVEYTKTLTISGAGANWGYSLLFKDLSTLTYLRGEIRILSIAKVR